MSKIIRDKVTAASLAAADAASTGVDSSSAGAPELISTDSPALQVSNSAADESTVKANQPLSHFLIDAENQPPEEPVQERNKSKKNANKLGKKVKPTSIAEKIYIIEEFKSSHEGEPVDRQSISHFARMKNIPYGTFHGWLKQYNSGRLTVLPDVPLPEGKVLYRLRGKKFPEIEKALAEYVRMCRRRSPDDKTLVSWPRLQEKARDLAKVYLPPEEADKFTASIGWVNNCMHRHGLRHPRLRKDGFPAAKRGSKTYKPEAQEELQQAVSSASNGAPAHLLLHSSPTDSPPGHPTDGLGSSFLPHPFSSSSSSSSAFVVPPPSSSTGGGLLTASAPPPPVSGLSAPAVPVPASVHNQAPLASRKANESYDAAAVHLSSLSSSSSSSPPAAAIVGFGAAVGTVVGVGGAAMDSARLAAVDAMEMEQREDEIAADVTKLRSLIVASSVSSVPAFQTLSAGSDDDAAAAAGGEGDAHKAKKRKRVGGKR